MLTPKLLRNHRPDPRLKRRGTDEIGDQDRDGLHGCGTHPSIIRPSGHSRNDVTLTCLGSRRTRRSPGRTRSCPIAAQLSGCHLEKIRAQPNLERRWWVRAALAAGKGEGDKTCMRHRRPGRARRLPMLSLVKAGSRRLLPGRAVEHPQAWAPSAVTIARQTLVRRASRAAGHGAGPMRRTSFEGCWPLRPRCPAGS